MCSGSKTGTDGLELTPDFRLSGNKPHELSGIKELTPKDVVDGDDGTKGVCDIAVDSYKMPEAVHTANSDCYIVGNKFNSLLSDESHHSRWIEFRNLASEGVSNECSRLLQRMELEDSDEEFDLLDEEIQEVTQNEVDIPLVDSGMV